MHRPSEDSIVGLVTGHNRGGHWSQGLRRAAVPVGNEDSVVMMTVSTTAPIASSARTGALLAATLPLVGIFWLGQWKRSEQVSKKRGRIVAMLLFFFLHSRVRLL